MVHTAVRLGHGQAIEESGVNGTRNTLFFKPKMYLFLSIDQFFLKLNLRGGSEINVYSLFVL